jgi:cytochrome c-type biogenesis protein CcmF
MTEDIRTMKPGDTAAVAGYDVTLEGFRRLHVSNYVETQVPFTVRRAGAEVAVVTPSKRLFEARGMATTEAGIKTFGVSQLYVSLGEIESDGTTVVRLFWMPLVTLIWIGPVIMALGGAMSLSDRRLRIGAPRPARRRHAEAAE